MAAALSVVRDIFYLTYQQTPLPGESKCAVYIDILHREASAPYVTSH